MCKNVIWSNKATRSSDAGWEVDCVNMRYANNAKLGWRYSHAVIFIKVLGRLKRGVIGSSVYEELVLHNKFGIHFHSIQCFNLFLNPDYELCC